MILGMSIRDHLENYGTLLTTVARGSRTHILSPLIYCLMLLCGLTFGLVVAGVGEIFLMTVVTYLIIFMVGVISVTWVVTFCIDRDRLHTERYLQDKRIIDVAREREDSLRNGSIIDDSGFRNVSDEAAMVQDD